MRAHVAGLLVTLALGVHACASGPSKAFRAFPADVKRAEACPTPEVGPGDYVELTVVEAGHEDPHLLMSMCSDKSTPGCTDANCQLEHQRQWCLGPKVYRKVYDRPMQASLPLVGSRFVVQPLCNRDGKCEAQLVVTVVNPDESVQRYSWCRLLGGQIKIEDGAEGKTGDFEDLTLDCVVKSKRGSGSRPCYPLY